MGLIARDYRQQMQALLPSGLAWSRALGSLLTRLLDALAIEFARVDGRAGVLIDEADPRTTAGMLMDWERVAGLPDNCTGLLADTQQARRNDLVSKLVGGGGQSRAYFIQVAAAMGFEVQIEEFRPFRAGSKAGTPLSNGDWRFAWRVRAPEQTVNRFKAGQSAAGEPLATWGNAALECRIRQNKPAHTITLFAYGLTGLPLLIPGGELLLMPDGVSIITE